MIRVCRSLGRRNPARSAGTGGSAPWGEHDPERPGWDCRACCAPWPCPVAQQRLQIAYQSRRRDLGILLAFLRDQAVIDLPDAAPHEIGTRFIGWYRRRDPLPASPRETTVARPATHDAMRPLLRDDRTPHQTDRVAQLNAHFAAFLAELDCSRADRGRVPDSVILAVAAAHARLAATDPDHREPACYPGAATCVLHWVDPRTGRRP